MKMQYGQRVIGAPLDRIDGVQKVTGAALYAYEYQVDQAIYAFPVQSTIAKGKIESIDASAALALPGVVAVISYENAPRLAPLDDADLAVFQADTVAYRGQLVAAVVAETSEIARQAASLIIVRYTEQPHDVVLHASRDDLYKPEKINGDYEPDTAQGDVESALALAFVSLDHTYTTPPEYNNPLEPHTTVAVWSDEGVTIYDSTQGAHTTRDTVSQAFGLAPERVHVIAHFVGGGFGSKGTARSHVMLTVMASKVSRRPVKLALTRQQMFSLAGYRTPTIQRVRLGAHSNGQLTAIAHDVIAQTATLHEFAEQAAVVTRVMYAAPNRHTTHRLARLDLPVNAWMRAPGECPGMFALESAMDELAIACGLDPIELRIRNVPHVDPETRRPFSSYGLVACLQEGARLFGWQQCNPTVPRAHQEGRWLFGTGVAASTYPVYQFPATAIAQVDRAECYCVRIDATDIGTGAWTALTQIAADALEVPLERVRLEIGDSTLPPAFVAGGSSGIASWGSAIVEASCKLRTQLREKYGGVVPAEGLSATGEVGMQNPQQFSMHAFGAQFAEVRVHMDTGEIRVPRLLGVFAAGRIINPKTARSQFLGGMTMGLSMALHEEGVLDPRFGDIANHDLADYHIATNADVGTIDAIWIDEKDQHVNPLGTKGIGEIGIVGTAAAIANAVFHATGRRVRNLPITLDKLL